MPTVWPAALPPMGSFSIAETANRNRRVLAVFGLWLLTSEAPDRTSPPFTEKQIDIGKHKARRRLDGARPDGYKFLRRIDR